MKDIYREQLTAQDPDAELPVLIIDTPEQLDAIAAHLQKCTTIYADTEFDDFNAQYGTHLQLVQVFDGTTCYLIDAVQITDLSPLWPVFENEHICKVLYAAANDIGLLKRYGCNTRNVFDVQVAASLCNRTGLSYAAVLQSELGISIDKSLQRSRWDNRPLKPAQVAYACKDVMYLPQLQALFMKEIVSNNTIHILQEENRLLEDARKEEYKLKLSKKQKAVFNKYAKTKLMQLKVLIDEYAQQLNVPPYYIIQDEQLSDILKDKTGFLKRPFETGFHKAVAADTSFRNKFLAIVHSIDSKRGWQKPAIEREVKGETTETRDMAAPENNKFISFKAYVVDKYGAQAAEQLLKGLSKKMLGDTIDWGGTRQYQRDLYEEYTHSLR